LAAFDKDASQGVVKFWFWFYRNRYFDTKGQEGNLKAIVSIKEDSAIINRMGFNNGGVRSGRTIKSK
jgi:dihydroorotate dehydrogenase